MLCHLLLESIEEKPQWKYNETDADSIAVLIDFSFTVKAETLIFISGRGSAIASAKEGKSVCFYNFVKS